MKPQITVIILNWNRKDYLRNALRSIEKQSMKNYEIMVVDNASSDGSVEMVEKEFPQVNLIKMPGNYGMVGRNLAMKEAKADIIVSLDNDATLGDNIFNKIIKKFEEDPKLGIISCKVLKPNKGDIDMWVYSLSEKDHINKEFYTFVFGAGVCAIKKNVLTKTGYYPEIFFSRGEEFDLAYRVYDKGYTIKYCPDILMYHDSSITKNKKFYHYLEVRNILWTYWRNLPFAYSLYRTFSFIISKFINSDFSLYITNIKAIKDALVKLPQIIKGRNPINKETLFLIEKINKIGRIN